MLEDRIGIQLRLNVFLAAICSCDCLVSSEQIAIIFDAKSSAESASSHGNSISRGSPSVPWGEETKDLPKDKASMFLIFSPVPN